MQWTMAGQLYEGRLTASARPSLPILARYINSDWPFHISWVYRSIHVHLLGGSLAGWCPDHCLHMWDKICRWIDAVVNSTGKSIAAALGLD